MNETFEDVDIKVAERQSELFDMYKRYLFAREKKLSREEFTQKCLDILNESGVSFRDFSCMLVRANFDIEGIESVSKVCSEKDFKMPLSSIEPALFGYFKEHLSLLSKIAMYVDKFYEEKSVTGVLHLDELTKDRKRILKNVDEWMRKEERLYRNLTTSWEFYLFGVDEFEDEKPKMLPRDSYASDEEFSAEVQKCLDALASQRTFKDASEAILADNLSLAKRGAHPRMVKFLKAHFGVDVSGNEAVEWQRYIQKNIDESRRVKPYEKLLPDYLERKRKETPSENV